MKKHVKCFRIKEEYLTNVIDIRPIRLEFEGKTIEGTSTGFIDHPEFTKLRDKLEALGYIKTQRQWHNGDTVLTPFKLNGNLFKKGDRFCGPSALANQFAVRKKLNK